MSIRGVAVVIVFLAAVAAQSRSSSTMAVSTAIAAPGVERPGFRIPMHHRDWSSAGSLVIEKLAGDGTYISTRELTDERDADFVLLRPGRCYAEQPSPNRSIHPYEGGEGELPVLYSTVRRMKFAVEVVAEDGRSLSCGRHGGAEALPTYAQGVPATGRARWAGGALVFSGDGLTLKLTPALRGSRTRVAATSDWGGSDGTLAHIRLGSCSHVAPGREWPMNLEFDGERATTDVVLAIPFSRILERSYAFEVHDSPIGASVHYCVDLAR